MSDLVLASQSLARAQILRQAGVAFDVVSPGVDEGPIKRDETANGASPKQIAASLAAAKARAVSGLDPRWVIGADQTLELDERLIDKAASADEALDCLKTLRGRTHQLHAAVALARGGDVVWRDCQSASLTMRRFSDDFLAGYMARNARAALSCVGAYELEGEGVQLFDAIDGDYFTILGLPIFGLLGELRRQGVIAA